MLSHKIDFKDHHDDEEANRKANQFINSARQKKIWL
jgi:hypothetical protein